MEANKIVQLTEGLKSMIRGQASFLIVCFTALKTCPHFLHQTLNLVLWSSPNTFPHSLIHFQNLPPDDRSTDTPLCPYNSNLVH
jgi:hypothetical protein